MSELTEAVGAPEPEVDASGRKEHLGWALVLICIAQLMVVLDATIANIALPYIGRDLDMSGTNLTWIVTEYSVGWLPELAFRLDIGYGIHYQVTGLHNVALERQPSEYIGTNLRCVSFPTEQPQKIMDATGEILMFGSDFPHAEGQLDPLNDYREQVGDMGDRSDAFYGETFAAAVGG